MWQGALVYKLRGLGFEAYGVDISELWDFDKNNICFYFLSNYKLPFDNEDFNLVISTSVIEHVPNKKEAFSEIQRVLEKAAYAAHAFSSRFYLIKEPHIKMPFASWFGEFIPVWYLKFFAILGIRNSHQLDMYWKEASAHNLSYFRDGLSYWTRSKYCRLLKPIYDEVIFDSAYASCGDGIVAGIGREIQNIFLRSIWYKLCSIFRNQLLLCKN